jgi:asparagine synthase (glutamine-hydrolysing)
MCAIAGVWTAARPGKGVPAAETANEQGRRVARMLEMQKHRGPEPNSVWVNGGLVLGHRRLAILDLSEAGRQPMHSPDGRWTIVFNGEIFNYRELRETLSGVFTTATDTEVLLAACAAWGVEGALARVHGMFGFALWDGARRELTLARDRAGEKPLVYFWDGATLAFASELKALESFHARRLDPTAVDAYLALGYVPAPLAIFAQCRKLPAGHLIRFQAATGEFVGSITGPERGPAPAPQRWGFSERTPAVRDLAGPCLRAGLMDELRSQVGNAVRLRLHADVPVALSLSGGVDSSVIAAECARQGARPEAFTVRFDGDETDLPFARQVAGHLRLRHTVLDAQPAALAARLDEIVFHYDEPFADSSALACFALAEAVGGRYRVVLDGDGGDEAFGGYRHYEYIGVKQTLKAAAAAAGWCDGAGSGRSGVYVQSKSLFRADERRRLLSACDPAVAKGGPACSEYGRAFVGYPRTAPQWIEEVEFRPSGGGALHRALHMDRQLALANGLTYKMDIALGAFAIEGRAPLLDHAVLEWAQTLPPRELVRGRDKKILLRAAYAGELPAAVLDRPKHGFGAPVNRWMDGPFGKLVRDSVPCPWFAESAQSGAAGQRRWALFMFSAWARRWNATW